MYIHGKFYDINNNAIEVQFIISNDTSTEKIIGENGLYFGGSPLTISTDVEDTFAHIIKQSLQINLVTKDYVGDLFFSSGARDIPVYVLKNNVCIFSGYVVPATYTQPFVHGVDEFTVNCTDVLSTLQYYNYKNVTPSNYEAMKQTSDIVSLENIVTNILDFDFPILYDKSKGLSSSATTTLFDDISLSEIIFYKNDADEILTQDEVLEGILQYLNLHIIQQGEKFYIFDWDSIRKDVNSMTFYDILNDETVTETKNSINITSALFADSDTNISIADVYNQISLKCDLDEQSVLIDSPLNKDKLQSLYSGKQKYMTEFISEGSGDNANNAFNAMVKGQSTNYKEASIVDWYMQVMTNPEWKLKINSTETTDDLIESDASGNHINQWKIPKYLKDNALNSALIRFGNVTKKGGETSDNSPVSKISMTDYLVISVNGNETSNETNHLPSDTQLRDKAPMIEYVGANSGGLFSPVDDDTINYLVFSGKLLLQPLVYESSAIRATRNNNYEAIRLNDAPKTESFDAQFPNYDEIEISQSPLLRSNLVKSDNNGEGRYYTRKFYTQEKVGDSATTYMTSGIGSLQPWTTDKSAHGYEYNYSASGDGSDRFSKLPILECELIIGDKRLIERNMDMYGNSTFEWVTVGQEPSETIDGVSYLVTTFSLGVNPKIDDFIIGDEFNLQNTIDYTMNLDAEGTAIPIRRSDNLSGKVTFRILGCVNLLWNDITRRHPSFWRHTQWSENARFVLAHTENIFIKEFECKIYSNNGMLDSSSGNDELIYMSAESDSYITKKDDIEFMLTTQLSSREALEKGVNTAVILNSPINTTTKLGISSLFNANTNETAKAEEHYVDAYYREYSTPKLLLNMTLHDDNTNFTDIYRWTKFSNKVFYPIAINKDIRLGRATLTLKEK